MSAMPSTGPAGTPAVPPSAPSSGAALAPLGGDRAAYVAVQDGGETLGGIVWWSLGGNVSLPGLVAALAQVGSSAKPPEEPSAIAAVHRAAETVARQVKGRALQLSRGHWAVVDRAADEETEGQARKVSFDLLATVAVERPAADAPYTLVVDEGPLAADLCATYAMALTVLAPADMGDWLCDKLTALGAVPLRDRGGVYFVPADCTPKFRKVAAALKLCSKHAVHVVPAMKATDAVEAILSAVEADTRASCDEIAAEMASGKLGKRALEAREEKTVALAARAARYEQILGVSLAGLKASIDEATQAVAVATLMLCQE